MTCDKFRQYLIKEGFVPEGEKIWEMDNKVEGRLKLSTKFEGRRQPLWLHWES
ncbi:hypothetical protein BNJ_00020 [Kaumoebavirus]|uniref:hypothetical protein n=1 Tax=Kaumoebavirus TaxID=1859492 RepID=UPI0009C3AF0C|nr:hypothetical protein BNJ_00020 [Kaumoebavirus]ARA71864.1 hypothetical protein BNJ_00020 [Kaumoebavirus]